MNFRKMCRLLLASACWLWGVVAAQGAQHTPPAESVEKTLVNFEPQLYTYPEIARQLSVGKREVICAFPLRNRAAFVCLRRRSWEDATALLADGLGIRFRQDSTRPQVWIMEEDPVRKEEEQRWRTHLNKQIVQILDTRLQMLLFLYQLRKEAGEHSVEWILSFERSNKELLAEMDLQSRGKAQEPRDPILYAIHMDPSAWKVMASDITEQPLYRFAYAYAQTPAGKQLLVELLPALGIPTTNRTPPLPDAQAAWVLATAIQYIEWDVYLNTIVNNPRVAYLLPEVLQRAGYSTAQLASDLVSQECVVLDPQPLNNSQSHALLIAQLTPFLWQGYDSQFGRWVRSYVKVYELFLDTEGALKSSQCSFFLSAVPLRAQTPEGAWRMADDTLWQRCLRWHRITWEFLQTPSAQASVSLRAEKDPNFWDFVKAWCREHSGEVIGEYFYELEYLLPRQVKRASWNTLLRLPKKPEQGLWNVPFMTYLEPRAGVILLRFPLAFWYHGRDWPLASLVPFWRRLGSTECPPQLKWQQMKAYFRLPVPNERLSLAGHYGGSSVKAKVPIAEPVYRIVNALPPPLHKRALEAGGSFSCPFYHLSISTREFTQLLKRFLVPEAYHPKFEAWLAQAEVEVRVRPPAREDWPIWVGFVLRRKSSEIEYEHGLPVER